MNSVCDCRQTMILYYNGDVISKRYETHLVSGKTGRYFKDKTTMARSKDVIIFSCDNPSCNTVFHMRDHIGETVEMITTQDYNEIWAKYTDALRIEQSGLDLELLSDFLIEFAKEQLVEFDKTVKGGKLLEARFNLEDNGWYKAADFVGNALMNSIRVYDIRYITNDIKLKVVDGHLEMSMIAVFGEEE